MSRASKAFLVIISFHLPKDISTVSVATLVDAVDTRLRRLPHLLSHSGLEHSMYMVPLESINLVRIDQPHFEQTSLLK